MAGLSDIARAIAQIGPWFIDAIKAPGRIKVLAEGLPLDRDPRPFCRSCGKGRIGNLTRIEGANVSWARGVCDHCGCNFIVTNEGKLGQVLDAVTHHESRSPE